MQTCKKRHFPEEMEHFNVPIKTWGGGRVSWDEVREWHGHIYTTKCKTDS